MSWRVRRVLASSTQRRHALVGPMDLWQVKREFQIAFLLRRGLRPDDRLADIGCGTLRGGIPIIDYLEPGNYHGLEVRAKLLEEADRELTANGLTHKHPVLTLSGDLGSLELGETFDVIWAFSVLIHMRDEVLDGALRFVSRHLAPSAAMYGNVTIGERSDGQWRGFPVVHRPWAFYCEAAARSDLDAEQIGTLRSLGHPPGLGDGQTMAMFTRRNSGVLDAQSPDR